jgi:hypothetical protein
VQFGVRSRKPSPTATTGRNAVAAPQIRRYNAATPSRALAPIGSCAGGTVGCLAAEPRRRSDTAVITPILTSFQIQG